MLINKREQMESGQQVNQGEADSYAYWAGDDENNCDNTIGNSPQPPPASSGNHY